MKRPEIGMKKSALTPPHKQTYFCPVCGREFPLSPAYGSRALRPMLSYLFLRYERHFDRYHGDTP